MNLKINSLIVAGVLCFSQATAQESALAAPAKKWITENAKTLHRGHNFFILKALNLLCKSLSYISPCRLNREFIVKENVSQLCHVFVEGRRKNLMSRCSNSSPRYSVRTTMPSLLILKISYVFNNKISITLLKILICFGESFAQSDAKI